ISRFAQQSGKGSNKENAARADPLTRYSPSCGPNMAYRVKFTPRAEQDLDRICATVSHQNPFRGPSGLIVSSNRSFPFQISPNVARSYQNYAPLNAPSVNFILADVAMS